MLSDSGSLINHLCMKTRKINYERQKTTTNKGLILRLNIPKAYSTKASNL